MSNEINPSFSSSSVTFDEPAMSKALPELTQDEFIKQSTQILTDGVDHHYSKEYVTDQLFHLAHKNPNTAKELGFPLDHPSIKQKMVTPWYGDRPSNGPDPAPGPEGEFEIIVHDEGGRDGPAYGGTLTVRRNDGKEAVTVPASSWPDTKWPNPGIQEGTYKAKYLNDGHKNRTKPGVVINDNNPIPTVGPNPVHDNQWISNAVHIHRGAITARGSQSCPVVPPLKDVDVWEKLLHNTEGTVTIERK